MEDERKVGGFVGLGSVGDGGGEKVGGVGFDEESLGGCFTCGAVHAVVIGVGDGTGKRKPGIERE